MIVIDRQEIATKWKELIDNAVGPAALNLAEAVLDYVPVSLQGRSPIVAIAPLRSTPGQSTAARISDDHDMIAYVFVLYSHTARQIDERDAWIVLNQLRTKVVQVIIENKRVEGLWSSVAFSPGGVITPIKMDDQGYLMEPLPFQVRVR